jgi:twinkle protein
VGTPVYKQPCEDCRAIGLDRSGDNMVIYEDGSGHCFAQGHWIKGRGNEETMDFPTPQTTSVAASTPLVPNEPQALGLRKLTLETCLKFGYGVGVQYGKTVQVAEYRNASGQVVANHMRDAEKRFTWAGDRKQALPLWGQHLWRDGGRRIAICEGELDAMSLAQALGGTWPVVSIPSGTKDGKNAIALAMGFLEGYDLVVLMFDEDDAGREAVAECAPMFEPGKVAIAHLPLKDPSALLQAGKGQDLIKAFWDAQVFKPGGLVTASDVMEQARKPTEWGLDWPFPSLTTWTYGRRRGEVIMLGAGTGVGKTDFFTECIKHTLAVDHLPAAAFYLEGVPADTVKRVAGKIAGKAFHVPDGNWTPEELQTALDNLEAGPTLHLLDHFGAKDWSEIKAYIRYLALAEGVKDFYIDHLTALADPANERQSLELLMEEAASLAMNLGVTLYMVSHLATPEGVPHEEGGRVMLRHFKGSRAIGFWSHLALALERNTQAEDDTLRQETCLRILKDRHTGRGNGKTIPLGFDQETSCLYEAASFATANPMGGAREATVAAPGTAFPPHPSDATAPPEGV